MSVVLVTGANGFIGKRVFNALLKTGKTPRAAVRSESALQDIKKAVPPDGEFDSVVVGDIGPDTDWTLALRDVEAVIHLAARVHVLGETPEQGRPHFERVNHLGTAALAETAAQAGVRRFVFASSVKVNGDGGSGVYTADDEPAPTDPYGESKLAAERAIADIAESSGMTWTTIRPPLVYGPGVKANFLKLMDLTLRRTPLPLGLVNNRRSLVFVDNLAAALVAVLDSPAAANRTFMIADGPPTSTAQLIGDIAAALGVRPRLLPAPPVLLRFAVGLLGRSDVARRLLGSLAVDHDTLWRTLAMEPPYSMRDGLRLTAEWHHRRHDGRQS